MSSNLKVNTILPSTGTTIGIGTVGGLINVVGNIDVNSTSGISTFNGLEISGIVTAKAGAAVTYYGDGSNLTGITDNVVTINSNTNDYLITGTGTANTLQGESTLTYDGNDLTQTTNASGEGIKINGGNNSTALTFDANRSGANNGLGNVYGRWNGTTVAQISFNAGSDTTDKNDGYIWFGTESAASNGNVNATERLRIDSYGVLRVGNTHSQATSGNTKRIALGAKASIWGWASGQINGALTLADNYYWDGANNKAIESDYSAYLSLRSGSMRFGCTASSQTGGQNISGGIHEKVRFENDGNVSIADGNLSFAAGHGIDFSANSHASAMSSELLDHYEEGSWTPVFQNNSVNGGTFPISTYIRIGRLVSISFHATVGGGSGSSGFKVTGLPFAPDKNGVAPVSTNCNIPCHCRIFDSSDRMEVHKFDSSDVTYQNLSDKFIMINATYRCNP